MTALFFGITSFDGFKFRLANELMSSTFSYMKLYDNLELATVCLHINYIIIQVVDVYIN